MPKYDSNKRATPKVSYPMKNKNNYIALPYYFTESEAFNKLNMNCIRMIFCINAHIQRENVEPNKRKKKKWIAINNGKLSISSSMFMKECGIKSKECVLQTRNRLIEVGILKIEQEGTYKIAHLYKLLLPNLVETKEQRWRDHPKKDWKHEIPKHTGNLRGKKTQFKSSPKNTDLSKSKDIDYKSSVSLNKWTNGSM